MKIGKIELFHAIFVLMVEYFDKKVIKILYRYLKYVCQNSKVLKK